MGSFSLKGGTSDADTPENRSSLTISKTVQDNFLDVTDAGTSKMKEMLE